MGGVGLTPTPPGRLQEGHHGDTSGQARHVDEHVPSPSSSICFSGAHREHLLQLHGLRPCAQSSKRHRCGVQRAQPKQAHPKVSITPKSGSPLGQSHPKVRVTLRSASPQSQGHPRSESPRGSALLPDQGHLGSTSLWGQVPLGQHHPGVRFIPRSASSPGSGSPPGQGPPESGSPWAGAKSPGESPPLLTPAQRSLHSQPSGLPPSGVRRPWRSGAAGPHRAVSVPKALRAPHRVGRSLTWGHNAPPGSWPCQDLSQPRGQTWGAP